MKTTLFFIVSIFFCSTLFSQGNRSLTVYYATDSYELISSEREKLDDFFDLFDASKITEIKLLGHTDSDGENDYNDRLAQNRAKSVRKYLVSHGLKSSVTESFGEKKPLNANSTDEEKSKNRRVEIIVSYSLGGLLSENDFKVFAYRNLPTSEYCIDPTRDTVLKLKRGGRVIFKANTFSSDGECVKIFAKEAYKKSEIILASLTTTSNGNLLESGGMVYLEARNSNGDELASKREFTVQMPTDNYLDSMMLFNGTHGPDSSLNWTQDLTEIPTSELLPNCWDIQGRFRYTKETKIDTVVETVINCKECKLFPCRIKRIGTFLGGTTDPDKRTANKTFRNCQRELKKSKKKKSITQKEQIVENSTYTYAGKDSTRVNPECEKLKLQLDSLGFQTYSEYYAFKMKEKREKFNEDAKAGRASFDDIKAYSMQSTRMGWINCDRFVSMPPKSKIRTFVPIKDDNEDLKNAQCTIVLSDRTSLIGSNQDGRGFRFIDLPKGLSIFILAVLMKNGKIFLSIDKTNIQNNLSAPQFKEVSYEELVRRLQILD